MIAVRKPPARYAPIAMPFVTYDNAPSTPRVALSISST